MMTWSTAGRSCSTLPVPVKTDNSLRDRRTAICVATLRHCTENESMKVVWVDGKSNIADILTKEGVAPDLMRSVLSGKVRLPAVDQLDNFLR